VALLLQELNYQFEVNVVAHALHKVLLPEYQKLFELHSLLEFLVIFTVTIRPTF
jgi:hypothetical protein